VPVCPCARVPVCPCARVPVCPCARVPVCPCARAARRARCRMPQPVAPGRRAAHGTAKAYVGQVYARAPAPGKGPKTARPQHCNTSAARTACMLGPPEGLRGLIARTSGGSFLKRWSGGKAQVGLPWASFHLPHGMAAWLHGLAACKRKRVNTRETGLRNGWLLPKLQNSAQVQVQPRCIYI
jgi:hypothetical protein